MDPLDRMLPHNLEAEKSVLGAILIRNESFDDVADLLRPEHFYRAAHRQIFQCASNLLASGSVVDYVTLKAALLAAGQLDEVGGPTYIAALGDGVPRSANIAHYARLVIRHAEYRKLIAAAAKVQSDAYEAEKSPATILNESAEIMLGVLANASGGYRTIAEVATAAVPMIEESQTRAREGITGVRSGFNELDNMLSGLQHADLLLVAARPSIGKAQPLTSLVLTPIDGWRRMADLSIGDPVLRPDGSTARVTGTFPQGVTPVVRVTFIDGRSVECSPDHLWRVHSCKWKAPRVIPTAEIALRLRQKRYQMRLSVDLIDGRHGRPWHLPIHPWLLGVLLGDGCLRGSCPRVSTNDPEVLAGIEATSGMTLTRWSSARCDYRLTMPSGRRGRARSVRNPVKQACCALGVWGKLAHEKRVPPVCFLADRDARLALLRGLLDTDGEASRGGSVVFSSTSEGLAHDVAALARSLGAVCSVRPKKAGRYTHKGEARVGRVSWRCVISYRTPWELFSIARKARRVTVNKRRLRLTIAQVEPVAEAETKCIALDAPDGLYVTDGYTVTHNTALLLNMARHVALESGLPVGIASLEMSAQQLYIRLLTGEARVDAHRFRNGNLRDIEYRRIVDAMSRLAEAPIYIDDAGGQTPTELRAKAKRLQHEHGLSVLFVDYVQLMETRQAGGWQSRQQEVSAISRALKVLAKDLNVPIVAACQLSRAPEARKDKRPELADLRESGALEQDADVVLLLHRPEHYERTEENDGLAECIVAKQRNGPIGTVKLAFIAEYTRFENLALA